MSWNRALWLAVVVVVSACDPEPGASGGGSASNGGGSAGGGSAGGGSAGGGAAGGGSAGGGSAGGGSAGGGSVGGGSAGGGSAGGGSAGGGSAGGGSAGGGSAGGGSAGGGSAGGGSAGGGSALPPTMTVYVGRSGGNIHVLSLNTATGAFTAQATYPAGTNPTFLAIDPAKKFLYAANEGGNTISAHRIDPATGALTSINNQPSPGGPAHVAVDRSGKWVMSANYGGGTVRVYPVGPDGGLGVASDTEAPGQNAHQILTDPTNGSALVPCLGSDLVAQFRFDSVAGTLTARTPASVATVNNAGPRHIAFHPNGRIVYLLNELNSTLTPMAFDPATGLLTMRTPVSSRAQGAAGNNTTAEVQVHPNGRFVYASNRGDNTIGIFEVSADGGAVTRIGQQAMGVSTPRHFSLIPGGSMMLVANQAAGTVTSYRVFEDGGVVPTGAAAATVPNAQFVEAIVLP